MCHINSKCLRFQHNMNESSDANQVNTLVYCMGDEADDLLRGLDLTREQCERYESVKQIFNRYFVPKENVIYCMNEPISTREYSSQGSPLTHSSRHSQKTMSMDNFMMNS